MTESRVAEFANILSKEEEFPSDWHIDYTDMFKGYVKVVPSKEHGPHRTAFVRFMKDNEDFQLTSTQTFNVLCVLKYDDKGVVSFGASLVMFGYGQDLYCYIYLIKTYKEHRGEGLATDFIKEIEAVVKAQVKPNSYLYIVAGMSEKHRPNGFFMNQGFSENAPEHMQDWQQKHCHCMMFRSVQHLVISQQPTEEQKSASFAANTNSSTANLKKRIQKQPDKEDDDGTSSVAPSTMSKATHKTASGAFKRHCVACEFKLIVNWSDHKKVHGGKDVEFIKCDINCSQCQDGIVVQRQKTSGQQCEHKVVDCSSCGQTRQVRYLSNSLCAKCSKKGSKTVIDFATTPLTMNNLKALNNMDGGEEMKEQSVLQKRTRDEYEKYTGEDQMPEFIIPQSLNKRLKSQQSSNNYNQLNECQELNSVMKDTSSIVAAPITATSATILLSQLQEIEKSQKSEYWLSIQVGQFCEEFVNQQALSLLKNGDYSKLASIITLMLNGQAGQLESHKLAGLFIAAFTLQGQCWTAAVAMLQKRTSEVKEYLERIFNSYINIIYGTDIAQWCSIHWRNLEEQQLNVLKAVRGKDSATIIILLSLVVQVDSVDDFVQFTAMIIQREFMRHIVASVQNRLTQQRLSMSAFVDLTMYMQQDNVLTIFRDNTHIFESTPLNQWQAKVEQFKATSHLMNVGSVIEAIEEYVKVAGPVEPLFADDLFTADSYLGLALHQCFNKPTAKQLGLSQYCIGTLRSCQRQLWCVPSGQGKSRIIAFAAAIAIHTRMFTAVHISFENEHLLNRDKADFESLCLVLDYADKVHYHVGCDFATADGELIIVDESDTVTFESPEKFAKLINSRACICFTATPDNCDANGVEAKVVSALHFNVFHYNTDAETVDAETRLKMDQIYHASTLEDKVLYIQTLVANGPVLVYGTTELKEALAAAITEFVAVNPQVDHSMLRKLDQSPYKVLFADSQFGMRGIDYRCERVTLHLVITKSFDCTREALQGVARVGRFGDQCKRIIMEGVELVDKKADLHITSELMKFVRVLMKMPTAKPIKLKAAAPQQRNTGGRNLATRHVQTVQAQATQQQQLMKVFTNTNK